MAIVQLQPHANTSVDALIAAIAKAGYESSLQVPSNPQVISEPEAGR